MPGETKYLRQERLTRRNDYLSVYKYGEKRVGRAFVCYAARRDGQGRKVGLAVSRKVGNAVVRNRVKRYLREVYRAHRAQISDNAHIVFVARPASARLDYWECEEAIRRLLREGGLLGG